MRRLFPALLTAAALLQPGCLRQTPAVPPVQIDQVRIGFPGGSEPGEAADERGRSDLFKSGEWTPVYVDLTVGPQGLVGTRSEQAETGFQVVVEASDSDNVQNSYRVPLPNLEPNQQFTALAYLKPGGLLDDVSVSVRAVTLQPDGRRKKDDPLIPPARFTPQALDLGDHLFLTIGPHLPKLREALDKTNQNQTAARSRVAFVDTVPLLPTEWFGYGAVDCLILPTGSNPDFLKALLNDQQGRKEALAEWVRRGGRLVLSTGHYQDLAKELLARLQMALPVDIQGTLDVPRLEGLERWLVDRRPPPLVNQPLARQPGVTPPIEMARLEPRPGAAGEILVSQSGGAGTHPLIVRAAHGLGQVTLIAFDLDRAPFTSWGGQADFWYKLLDIPRPQPNPTDQAAAANPYPGYGENPSGELATSLQRNLEDFAGVPVISFGWVALFIFLYILVVGPLDYLFLKKVVKRLEWTWLTFPVVVITVSVLAYAAAYYLKGNEQKINKLDLIDVDLASPQGAIYGHTWFAIFSPRTQHYTIGLEPAHPVWTPDSADNNAGVLVSWLGRPEEGFGGYGRTRSQGFFRSAYEYAPAAAGLEDVPLQVWATKTFQASWERPLSPQGPAPLEVNLHRSQSDPQLIVGTITNRLPVPLEDAYLISGGDPIRHTAFSLGDLASNEARDIRLKEGDQGTRMAEWAASFIPAPYYGSSAGPTLPNNLLLREALFHDEVP
ncbi:MAG: hypothetical protein JO112_16120, partial [Planctomycetes bacterium]|nr:hypothetical protein [Planctomycetota bacterium]